MDFAKIVKIVPKLKHSKIFNRRSIFYLILIIVGTISYFVFRHTPKMWISATFDYGGIFGFSLNAQEQGPFPNINLFTDNFIVALLPTLGTNRSGRAKPANDDEIREEKPAFIINFPGWGGVKFPNSDQTILGAQKAKGNLDIFFSLNTDMLEKCLEEKGYINFKSAKLLSRNSRKLLDEPIQAESFTIKIFVPTVTQDQDLRPHTSKGEMVMESFLFITPVLYLCPFSQLPEMKGYIHLDLHIDDKDYFMIGQKGFDIEELGNLKKQFTVFQKEIPPGTEDVINLYVLDKSSEDTHYRSFFLNPDYCSLIVPPRAIIDIRYEKKGKEYEIPRITTGRDTYAILILSDLSPNDILFHFPSYKGALTKVTAVLRGKNHGIEIQGLIGRVLIVGTKGEIKLASEVYKVMDNDQVYIGGSNLVLNRKKNKISFMGKTDELVINDQRLSKSVWETIPTEYKAGILSAAMGGVIGFILGRLKQGRKAP